MQCKGKQVNKTVIKGSKSSLLQLKEVFNGVPQKIRWCSCFCTMGEFFRVWSNVEFNLSVKKYMYYNLYVCITHIIYIIQLHQNTQEGDQGHEHVSETQRTEQHNARLVGDISRKQFTKRRQFRVPRRKTIPA